MHIVDSQVHIWKASTPERPWPPRHAPHRPVPVSYGDLLRDMDAAGVDRAVIVPPGWEGERNDYGLEAARMHPDRLAVMGQINLETTSSREVIASWRQQPGMLGIRLSLKRWKISAIEWLCAEAEAAGVPIMMAVVPPATPDIVDRMAERYPGLKIAIDHMGIPNDGKKDEAALANLDKLLALARRPNIAVKVSALPSFTTDTYPYRRLHPYVRRVHDAYGAKRMFWGTDLTKLPCTYRQAVTMFTEEMPWFTNEEMEWIMGRGLCEWIGWKLP